MFLLPGLVITWYVTETPIPEHIRTEIKRYLFARQHPDDGGWGLHIEGESTVYGTAMNYVVMRILGASEEDPRLVRARGTLHKLGGALHGPHWAKFWLSVLGVTDWSVVNPVPPDLWYAQNKVEIRVTLLNPHPYRLMPNWVPFHPWRWWIHMRQVYTSMSYIWSRKFQYPLTPLARQLRDELFVEPYSSISFASHRNTIAPVDNYNPKSWALNALNWVLVNVYNPYLRINSLKQWSEDWAFELIQREDENTEFANLGPANGPLNLLACYVHDGPDAESVRRHRSRMHDFLWMKNEGMLMNGTNGVQTWDTAFAIQAITEAGFAEEDEFKPMLIKALEFLEDQQIRENCREMDVCYRHRRKGAWAFSEKDQGYTVSDCTAEGLKSVLLLQSLSKYPKLVPENRLCDAVDTLLSLQNPSGGFASYELQRGSEYLELLNAAEVFGRIMIEYDYPECTTSVVIGLSYFRNHDPSYRATDIKKTIDGAIRYIHNSQRPDGFWYGAWGICFTYATMFAAESLRSVGELYSNSLYSRRACDALLAKQRPDGGWGESYRSCEISEWVEHPDGSQVVNTCWALLSLMYAECPARAAIEKGVKLVMGRQQSDGGWLQEGIEGVFNKSWQVFPHSSVLSAKPSQHDFLSQLQVLLPH